MEQHRQHLKSDLTDATIVVSNQLTKLKMLNKRIALIDKDFRYKIACNLKKGNNARARVMANELSNIHHVNRISQNMCLALEVIVLRFSTINEFAKILETINPTIETIKDIQNDIWNVVPTAKGLFNEMASVTSEVLLDSKVKVDSNILPRMSMWMHFRYLTKWKISWKMRQKQGYQMCHKLSPMSDQKPKIGMSRCSMEAEFS